MPRYEIVCPYCGSIAPLESSKKVYAGHDYGLMYICSRFPECNSYVQADKITALPVGRMANAELREWKKKAHQAFDPIWLNELHLKRRSAKYIRKNFAQKKAYIWLADQLKIPRDKCRIGEFDVETCKRVVEFCKKFMDSHKKLDILDRGMVKQEVKK